MPSPALLLRSSLDVSPEPVVLIMGSGTIDSRGMLTTTSLMEEVLGELFVPSFNFAASTYGSLSAFLTDRL